MKKKIILIVIILVGFGLLIGGVVISVFTPSTTNKPKTELKDIQTEQVTKDEVTKYIELLYSDDVTIAKVEKFTGSDIGNDVLFIGEDSYLRERPSNKVINKYNLQEYKNKQDIYASNVEKIMRDNLDYQLGEYIVSEEGDIVQKFSYRTYYYQLYLGDLNEVINILMPSVFDNYSEMLVRDLTEEELVKMYQLKIKALEVMNDYVNNYVNNDEIISFDLIYKKENNKILQDYFSLLVQLSGSFYQNVSYQTAEEEQIMISNRITRVQEIINTAVNNQTLDMANPLQLAK